MPCKNGGFRAIEGVNMVRSQLCAKELSSPRENLVCSSADFGHAEWDTNLDIDLAVNCDFETPLRVWRQLVNCC
jgi:hypothetical protein